jgi:transposase-like protein
MAPIDLALEYLQSLDPEEKINYSQIAKKFGVDRSTLSRRHRQVNGSKEDQYYAQALLNKRKSAVLINLVNELAKIGVPVKNARLAEFAKALTGKEPGKNWASRWVKQHSDRLIPVQKRAEDEEEDEKRIQALREENEQLKIKRDMLEAEIARLGDEESEDDEDEK